MEYGATDMKRWRTVCKRALNISSQNNTEYRLFVGEEYLPEKKLKSDQAYLINQESLFAVAVDVDFKVTRHGRCSHRL